MTTMMMMMLLVVDGFGCTFMQKRTSLISVERRGELTLSLSKGNCTFINFSGKGVV